MTYKRAVLIALGFAAGATAAWSYYSFRRDLARAERRVLDGSQVMDTRCGAIEYASVGDGFPVLVIHGAGGGFDQLRSLESEMHLSERGFRLIFISRFGYLRSPLPKDASTEAQADLYAALLDKLGIERAAVVAVSAGGPSGLEFCARYPNRCAALALLVPAAFVPGLPATAPNEPPLTRLLRNSLLKSDFAFWLATRLARRMMIENILATPFAAAERASAAERERMNDVMMGILPVSRRYAGLLNDAAVVAHLKPADVARIEAPVLLLSLEDDLYGTFRSARYLAEKIPGARLVMYREGGHLWVGHGQEVAREVTEFLMRR